MLNMKSAKHQYVQVFAKMLSSPSWLLSDLEGKHEKDQNHHFLEKLKPAEKLPGNGMQLQL